MFLNNNKDKISSIAFSDELIFCLKRKLSNFQFKNFQNFFSKKQTDTQERKNVLGPKAKALGSFPYIML